MREPYFRMSKLVAFKVKIALSTKGMDKQPRVL
jgi:hypothetical protein